METPTPTFEQTQRDVAESKKILNELIALLIDKKEPQLESDKWFDLNELVQYDPEKRSKPTFYGYVSNRLVPFHKRGKKLIFLKSEIDQWLKAGRVKTDSEIEADADTYLSNKK